MAPLEEITALIPTLRDKHELPLLLIFLEDLERRGTWLQRGYDEPPEHFSHLFEDIVENLRDELDEIED